MITPRGFVSKFPMWPPLLVFLSIRVYLFCTGELKAVFPVIPRLPSAIEGRGPGELGPRFTQERAYAGGALLMMGRLLLLLM